MSAYTDGAGFPSHEVLVITDLAPASTNAVWRAALIARENGASLRLLHVGGERRRMTQVHEALEEIRDQVHARLGIELNAEVVEGEVLPKTQIFHALGAGSEPRATATESVASRPSDTAMQRAHSTLSELIRSSGAQKLGAVSAIAFGHAANCVLARERATGAELVVIGKRRRGLLADFILGGVTQQVLAGSRADVLVMPSTGSPA